ncbi:MAG: endonuclease domain-containing protein [Chitinophagales bacterium]|nr:endonuclease domain-containing protein [Chitinophagales bacterium]
MQEFAKEMRKNSTPQEDKMWQELKNEKFYAKFRRQHVIENFIPDFVCLELKLIIEIDGGIHNIPENIEKDLGRTYELEQFGYTILRFTNDEVDKKLSSVLVKINEKIRELEMNATPYVEKISADKNAPIPNPSPDGGRETKKLFEFLPLAPTPFLALPLWFLLPNIL